MWSLLPRKTQVLIVTGFSIIAAWALEAGYSLISGKQSSVLHWISLSSVIVGVAVAAIAGVVWRPLWRCFPSIEKRTFPDLSGSWTGELRSTWVNPETGQTPPPIPTTLTIRQGLFSTSVKLQTGESISYSARCFLEPFVEEGRFRLWYSYSNSPQAQFQHRSSPHQGVAWLDMDYDANADRLVGAYFTARKTTGDIDVSRKRRRK